MYICYGHTIESHRDPLVEISETAAQEVAETILKGSLVNMLPMGKSPLRTFYSETREVLTVFVARHLPDWFGFHRSARECRRKVNLMLNVPYESVRRHMVWSFINIHPLSLDGLRSRRRGTLFPLGCLKC